MNNISQAIMLGAACFALGFAIGHAGHDPTTEELYEYRVMELEELQDEFDAYSMCMQVAGTTRCSMQPSDFVRFFQLKRILESDQ